MRFISLFAGIGGFDLGFERAGMTCVAQCEIDPHARAVLAHHWPNVEKIEDVTTFKAKRFRGAIDVVCGGFPCQDLSVAGRRAGLAGDRSGLWWQFHRIVREVRPRFVVAENVPGLFSSNQRRDVFAVIDSLVQLDYRVAVRVLDAQYCGLAQRRARVFIAGSLGDGSCAEVLFDSASVGGRTPPGSASRQDVAGTLGGGAGERGWCDDTDRATFIPAVAPTLTAKAAKGTGGPSGNECQNLIVFSCKDYGADAHAKLAPTLRACGHDRSHANGGGQVAVAHTLTAGGADASEDGTGRRSPLVAMRTGVRRLTPRECERLQGFPDDFSLVPYRKKLMADGPRYRMLGNAVAVPVAEWIGRRIKAVR